MSLLGRRSIFQIAFLATGLLIWAYGQRVEDPLVRLVGIAFFAVAFLLRFFRGSDTRPGREDEHADEESSPDQ